MAASGTADSFGVPLQPGDVIALTVVGEPEITGQYAIREDGLIIFPILGATKVIGYTPTQLADHLAELLAKYVVKPIVAVNTIAAMPRIVSILGEVARPGVYLLGQCPTLLSLLAVSGSATPAGDLSQAILVRKNETVRLVPDDATGPRIPHDIPLEQGDAVFIPSKQLQGVFVMGAVKVPGVISLAEAATASKAIVMAGGPLLEGDAAAAYVLRGGKQLAIDLSPYTQAAFTAGAAQDMALEAGDVLMVPTKSDAMVYVTGEVRLPGPQPHAKTPMASTAISLAGGLTEFTDGRDAYVLRHGEKIAVDLRAVLRDGKAETDQALQPGDLVVVPKQLRTIYLVGQVLKPGPYPLDSAENVMAAWALAGGPSPEADLHNAMLLRGAEIKRVDLEALVDKGEMQYNLVLEPGDQLVVPRILTQVYVLGSVNKPGAHPIQPGDTLIDLLARAGGPSPVAAANAIMIGRRAEPTDGQAQPAGVTPAKTGPPTPPQRLATRIQKGIRVDIMDLARVQSGEAVYLARPGDVIYVPAIKQKTDMNWMQWFFGMVSSVVVASVVNN
jgi:protein involved in polysaccharide export with SLBB domain